MSLTKLTLIEWSQPRRWALAVTEPAALWLLAIAVIGALLVAGEAVSLTTRHSTARLAVDSRAATLLLDGFYKIERDARGPYRWTSGDSQVVFGPVGLGGPLVLKLHLGPATPQLTAAGFKLWYDGQPATTLAIE